MKHQISFIIISLLAFLSHWASAYELKVEVVPEGGGTVNLSSDNFSEGKKISLGTSPNNGFKFVSWQNSNGEIISESPYFTYVMPGDDTVLYAVYNFNPENPANPDQLRLQHTLTVKSIPEGGGTFNTYFQNIAEESSIHLYAYPNSGFIFRYWADSSGNHISEEQNFEYVMGTSDVEITGVFEFSPANPENPAKNYWNPDTGEVIVDDFTPGSLSNTIYDLVGYSNRDMVQMITVSGRMNVYDCSLANDYSNCTLLDFSRATGLNEIPSYAFDYTKIETIILPCTVEKIGYAAFKGCQSLSSVTCYAMIPPVLESQVFDDIPEGLIIYVPAAALSQYLEAEGWSDFTIMPITQDVRNLTVRYPSGTPTTDYSGLWLEIINKTNGQRIHLLTTDRDYYTFGNVIRNTKWDVELRNEAGDVFATACDVNVNDEDVDIVLGNLAPIAGIKLKVITPDGEDVTSQVQISWSDPNGNFLNYGNGVKQKPTGTTVFASTALPQELLMQYLTPETTLYEVSELYPEKMLILELIPNIIIKGSICDAQSGVPLSGATVSASQTFGGKYTRTISARTDGSGLFSLEGLNTPTTVTFSASDYVSQSTVCDSLLQSGLSEITLSQVALNAISGPVINLSVKYKKTVAEGKSDEEWFADYENITYTVDNLTKGMPVTDFSAQYPRLVLIEGAEAGDELQITTTSRTGAFVPTTVVAHLDDDGTATSEIILIEPGRISAKSNADKQAVGMLYGSTGNLIKTYPYASDGTLTTGSLENGAYTLISMEANDLLNSTGTLAQLAEAGLMAGTNYVSSDVQIKDGEETIIEVGSIPSLGDAAMYYTGDATSFTVNKAAVVAGNFLTLTGKVDFKSNYASKVSDVEMIIDLPDNCEFVDNSVMLGNSTASYSLDGNRLIVPMPRYTDRLRFCILPTLGGDYAPSAMVRFTNDDTNVTQPIGSARFSVQNLVINVPKTVAKSAIPVSGVAPAKSQVEIYDNNVLIGTTTTFANGAWSATCELDKPYNLSTHKIYAKITDSNGLELKSETMECRYDMYAIQVSKVKMYHDNPEQNTTYELTFDFLNPSGQNENYIYYIYNKMFTFTIDFTDNSPDKVSNVVLYVKTAKGKWIPLTASYDSQQDLWVAAGEFGNMYDGDLPINVAVDFHSNNQTLVDNREVEDIKNIPAYIENMPLLGELDDIFADANLQDDYIDSLVEESLSELGEDKEDEADDLEQLSEEELLDLLDQYFSSLDSSVSAEFALPTNYDKYGSVQIGEYLIQSASTSDLTKEGLLDAGFIEIPRTDGSSFFHYYDKTTMKYTDLNSGEYYSMEQIAVSEQSNGAVYKLPDEFNTLYNWESALIADQLIDKAIGEYVSNIKAEHKNWQKARRIKKMCDTRGFTKAAEKWTAYKAGAHNAIKGSIKHAKFLKSLKPVAKAIPFLDIAIATWEGSECWDKVEDVLKEYPKDCTNPEALKILNDLQDNADTIKKNILAYYSNSTGLSLGAGELVAVAGAACPPSLFITVPLLVVAQYGADKWFENNFNSDLNGLKAQMNNIKKKCNDEPKDDGNHGQESGEPDKGFGIDPSGYVYEAVSSNRIEGVTATIYYKEAVEDMYGDFHDEIVLWDAEEYAQKNPLFTDSDGMYRWDVPQGMWQVKFEKEGYETTYSEWLPVPPPQLDVNIPISQNRQPVVKEARAYPDAIEVIFDKYMMPEDLTNVSIRVSEGDNNIEGKIEMLDLEAATEGSDQHFASHLRFNADRPFESSEVEIFVSRKVRSYAEVAMNEDFMQTFTVEPEVKTIEVAPNIELGYGESTIMRVQVLPAAASAGRKLSVSTSAKIIASVEMDNVIIDSDGVAEVRVTGVLPGTSQLTFTVEKSEVKAETIVKVVFIDPAAVPVPTASIPSGSTVPSGTELYLSCEDPEAEIYYTLDGSCPCDDTPARTLYDGQPIIITQSVTIRAMAVIDGVYESDVVKFSYIVEDAGVQGVTAQDIEIYPLPLRDMLNICLANGMVTQAVLTDLSGKPVAISNDNAPEVQLNTTGLPQGIYILTIKTNIGHITRKVVKVE